MKKKKKVLTYIIRWQQKRTTHSRIHIMMVFGHIQARCPHKKLLPQPGRNQALNIRKKRNPVHHNRQAPHACVTTHHLLRIVKKYSFPRIKINTLIIPPNVDQEPELRAHIMQDGTGILRQRSKVMFICRLATLPHSRHNRPIYTSDTAKSKKPEAVKIMFISSGQE